jgi:hypothetical protein
LKEIFNMLSQAKTSASGWGLVWPAQSYRDWAICPRVPKKWAMPWARSMPCSSANDALCLERTKKGRRSGVGGGTFAAPPQPPVKPCLCLGALLWESALALTEGY